MLLCKELEDGEGLEDDVGLAIWLANMQRGHFAGASSLREKSVGFLGADVWDLFVTDNQGDDIDLDTEGADGKPGAQGPGGVVLVEDIKSRDGHCGENIMSRRS